MTTIAFDKQGYIAWDSQVTVGTDRLPYAVDKVWIADGKLYAFAGDLGRLDAVIDWHRSGAVAEEAPKGNWAILVVRKRGAQVFTNDAVFPSKVTPPFAMGSGEKYALGALDAHASAFDAVRIAKKRDTNTGGRVSVIHRSEIK